jgi:hypothetical protein
MFWVHRTSHVQASSLGRLVNQDLGRGSNVMLPTTSQKWRVKFEKVNEPRGGAGVVTLLGISDKIKKFLQGVLHAHTVVSREEIHHYVFRFLFLPPQKIHSMNLMVGANIKNLPNVTNTLCLAHCWWMVATLLSWPIIEAHGDGPWKSWQILTSYKTSSTF